MAGLLKSVSGWLRGSRKSEVSPPLKPQVRAAPAESVRSFADAARPEPPHVTVQFEPPATPRLAKEPATLSEPPVATEPRVRMEPFVPELST